MPDLLDAHGFLTLVIDVSPSSTVDGGTTIQYDNDAWYANWEGFVAKTGSSGLVA